MAKGNFRNSTVSRTTYFQYQRIRVYAVRDVFQVQCCLCNNTEVPFTLVVFVAFVCYEMYSILLKDKIESVLHCIYTT